MKNQKANLNTMYGVPGRRDAVKSRLVRLLGGLQESGRGKIPDDGSEDVHSDTMAGITRKKTIRRKGGVNMKFYKSLSFKLMRRESIRCFMILGLTFTIFSSWIRFDNSREAANSLSAPATVYLPVDIAVMETSFPIRNNYEIFSAVYEVHRAMWDNVHIRRYFYPKQVHNLHGIDKGMLA